MILSSITSFFKKNKSTLTSPNSMLNRRIKDLVEKNNLLLYENVTIYHHSKSFFIPLLILDVKHGIFLFEYKDWSYDDLKNSTIHKASNQESNENSLSFEKTHTFLRQKLQEVTNNKNIPILNYLIMENLNTYEYKHLNDSFKELLPEKNVLFNDSTDNEILHKLHNYDKTAEGLPDIASLMANLLIQHSILKDNGKFSLTTKEQSFFIDSKIEKHQKLIGASGSGKTNAMILKIILELVKNPNFKIVVIKPTILSCHIIKKKLLDTIKNSLVKVDLNSLKIIIQKEFKSVDLVMCDDAYQFDDEYIEYIKRKQKNSSLVLINPKDKSDALYDLSKSFKTKKEVIFQQGNTHALALLKISKLLKENSPNDILVVSNNLSRKKLRDDLEHFIQSKALILDNSVNFLYQIENDLLLCEYSNINELKAKHVILLDICLTSIDKLKYAFNLCDESVHILYEDECDKIDMMRNNFE